MKYPPSFDLHHYPVVTSTMDVSREKLINQNRISVPPLHFTVLADCQNKGRGRMDRQWLSPVGNFYATYVVDTTAISNQSGLFSIATGIAIAQAFKDLDVDIRLKWPNDIFIGDKKVGGVLIEIVDSYALIGVGLNLKITPEGMFLKPATSILQACQKSIIPIAFHDVFSHQLIACFKMLISENAQQITKLWQEYCLHHQQVVSIQHNNLTQDAPAYHTGRYYGLDVSGALILEDLETGAHQFVYVGDAV